MESQGRGLFRLAVSVELVDTLGSEGMKLNTVGSWDMVRAAGS